MKSKYMFSDYLKAILTFVVISLLTFITNSWGQVSMTIGGSNYQNFNSLSYTGGTWTDNSTIPNWYWQENSEVSTYTGDDGSSHPSITTRYAYWKNSETFPEHAMGGISTGGIGIAMGVQFINNSGAPIEDIKVSYTGEQWHFGGSGTPTKITFWYKVSASPITNLTPGNNTGWSAITALDFTSPIAYEGEPSILNGDASENRTVFTNISIPNLNIPDGSYIMLRWSYPSQVALHGLAIDDVNISWIGNSVINNGNWDEVGNWNWGIPDNNTNAIINGAAFANMNAACYNLIINSSKELTIYALDTLTVNNNFLIKSSSSGVGSFINNSKLNINGSSGVEMYIPGTTIHNGIYFSPPLYSIIVSSVSDIVYSYNASACKWVIANGLLNIGTGYTVRSNSSTTIKLKGDSLFNSDLYIGGLVRQASPNNYGWNLIGNPYVCGMDWEVLNDTPSNYINLINGFYIRASDGSLVSYVNGIGTPAGTSSIIPPFHGFYAQVLNGQTTGSLNIPLNTRTHNTHNFYKNVLPIIRMQLTSNEGFSDETVLRIDDNATEKFDNEFDGAKMFADNENIPQIFSITSENDKLCINAISIKGNQIVNVPIGIQTAVEGEYTIKAFDFANVDKSISFFLKDKLNNNIKDLRKNPVYVFNSSNTYDVDRFVVIINKQSAGFNNDNITSKILISSINKTIIIDLQGETNTRVEVYNILGELILNKKLYSSAIQKIDLSVNEGIYIVKVISNTSTTAKRVMIK